VYVLPNTEQCREHFEWIRSEIVALGGEATVFAADAISEGGTDDIVAMFRRTREQEYHELKIEIDRLAPRRTTRRPGGLRNGTAARSLRALRDRFRAIERINFFDAPARAETAAALARLEQAIAGRRSVPPSAPNPLSPAGFHDRRWVTRYRPGVDRMASAWLIRRFIDSNATFVFAERPAGSDVPFDMYTGEFSHRGELCTFEVLADRFQLKSLAIAKVGHIVHDLDMNDTKYDLPEAAAVARIVEGLRALHQDDATLLEHGIGMFDALAHAFESDLDAAQLTRQDAAPRRAKTKKGRRR
jgi:hypothetical protein